MNQGIFGFPTPLTGSILSVTEFDASGTYTIPDDITSLEILLVGGGGGGGGGGRVVQTPATNITSGGGNGGSGGGITHHIFYKNDIKNIKNLIITIGIGGNGGRASNTALTALGTPNEAGAVGQPGGSSYVRTNDNPLFGMHAVGGAGAFGGGVVSAAGVTLGTARSFYIAGTPSAMSAGAVGSVSTFEGGVNGPHLQYNTFRNNGGAGGGSATSTTNALAGGCIRTPSSTYSEPYVINLNYAGSTLEGLTAAFGGNINLGSTLGKGDDGILLYKTSAGYQYFSGFGGAGGGAANSVGGGNGGNGYRGGGGGGGGGVRTSTDLALNQVISGAGGRGGNGYCRIIARK